MVMFGGNDFKVESKKPGINNKTINNQIWGVYQNGTLYLNGIGLTGLKHLAKVEVYGKYCYIKPCIPESEKIKEELHYNKDAFPAHIFGPFGGGITGANNATKRIPMIYCLTDGKKFLLHKRNLLFLFDKYPDLREAYLAENEQESEEIYIKYIKEINMRNAS